MGEPQLGLAQLIIIFLFGFSTVTAVVKHGEPREGEHSAIETFVANALMMWLLYEGGFFS